LNTKRSVGRPRQFDDESERTLIFDAAYAAMRDRGQELTIADILAAAGVSTRSFYRHFESKDALLYAMYLRDGEWAAERLLKRLADATSPVVAVEWWIDEIFSFTATAQRAERVAVLSSITGGHDEAAEVVAAQARQLLVTSLRLAIEAGVDEGVFDVDDVGVAAELVAVSALHAAGLGTPHRGRPALDQHATTQFCLRALGGRSGVDGE
jgi:AcrR family transcriptional regulator